MKNLVAIILLAVGAILMGYGNFGAVGQSATSAWQITTPSTQSGPGWAWKINTATGVTYFCMAAQHTCARMARSVVSVVAPRRQFHPPLATPV
jgi:hypothetical protein